MSMKRREQSRRIRAEDGTTLCSCGCGQAPKPPRRTWFSDECVEAWKIKNDPGYVRMLLERRDHGICALCGCDSQAEYRKWQEARKEAQRFVDRLYYGDHPCVWSELKRRWHFIPRDPNPDYGAINRRQREIFNKWALPGDWTAGRSTGWDADHILEVVNGGGQCGLENYQTLCHPCHKAKTRRLAGELAARRREARS